MTSSTDLSRTESLEEIVDRFISLGYKDIHDVADQVINELGDEKRVLAVVKPYIRDFLANMARQYQLQASRCSREDHTRGDRVEDRDAAIHLDPRR